MERKFARKENNVTWVSQRIILVSQKRNHIFLLVGKYIIRR